MWSLNSMLGLMFRPEGALVEWMNEWIDEWMAYLSRATVSLTTTPWVIGSSRDCHFLQPTMKISSQTFHSLCSRVGS